MKALPVRAKNLALTSHSTIRLCSKHDKPRCHRRSLKTWAVPAIEIDVTVPWSVHLYVYRHTRCPSPKTLDGMRRHLSETFV